MTKSILKLKPLSEALGVEIKDISIEDALKQNVFTEVYKTFLEHHLILFNDIDLSPVVQVEFAKKFGDVQVHVMNRTTATAIPKSICSQICQKMASLMADILTRALCIGIRMGLLSEENRARNDDVLRNGAEQGGQTHFAT